MNRRAQPNADPRGPLWLAALLYTAFVIYGSLVPLEFRALSWDEAVTQFGQIRFLKLGIGSRADWVANLLLFIPLTFLWMGALTAGGGRLRTALVTFALIPAATALSVGIEFTQLFFPQRTVSQNDIFAETLGGVIGVLVWWGTGRRFLDWLQAWRHTHARAALAERLAWVYLAGVLVYNVLPLDLTISVVEIFHQWRDGKVNLIPFGRLPADPAYAVYEIVTDALIWTPLALLWRFDGRRSAWRVWGMTLATAVVLEILQLFVFSRVSDVTDCFTAAAGAALGVWLGGRLGARERVGGEAAPGAAAAHMRGSPISAWLPFALAAGWVAVLLFTFWFPFDFRGDGAFIKDRLDSVWRVPFEAYYFGTEFRAITEVLRKTLFFAPLGGLLAWGVSRQPWRWRGPLFALAMLALVLTPAVVELGQVMLPEKIADFTDWLLAWLGGLAGYGVARRMLRAPSHAAPLRTAITADVVATPAGPRLRWHLPLVVVGMALLFWTAARAAFMPYNVRELLQHDSPVLSALLLALACYWLAVWPVWLARRRVSGAGRLWQLPVGLLLVRHGEFSAAACRGAGGKPVRSGRQPGVALAGAMGNRTALGGPGRGTRGHAVSRRTKRAPLARPAACPAAFLGRAAGAAAGVLGCGGAGRHRQPDRTDGHAAAARLRGADWLVLPAVPGRRAAGFAGETCHEACRRGGYAAAGGAFAAPWAGRRDRQIRPAVLGATVPAQHRPPALRRNAGHLAALRCAARACHCGACVHTMAALPRRPSHSRPNAPCI
jgi:glycopeptide antibiotics resistance protein